MLFVTLVFSAMLLVVVNAVARAPKPGGWLACVAAAGGVFFGFVTGHLLLLVNAILLFLAAGICLSAGGRARALLWTTVAATVVTYGIFSYVAIQEVQEWARLRKVYPIESMDQRLAYETGRHQQDRGPQATTPPNLSRLLELEKQVQNQEKQWRMEMRNRSLQHLHASQVKQFIDSQGFGVGAANFLWHGGS